MARTTADREKDERFFESIKKSDREIKGYVEVVYKDVNNASYYPSFPSKAEISGYFEINDDKRKVKNYASLEENYTELDGSFLLPNKKVVGDDAGYISSSIFESVTNPNFILDVNNPLIEEEYRTPVETVGLTIYFFNNIAQDFQIKITDNNNVETIFNIENNQSSVFHQIFDNPITISKMEMVITSMEYPNRRIRIPEIDFGITDLYEDNELISFTTNEEVDIFMQSLPVNDCSINLNNYDHDFDPLNPKGLVQYLTEKCLIKPYVGVLTEENGFDYRSLGNYYLNDWSANSDGNVTLNGQSLMGILNNLELRDSSSIKILTNKIISVADFNDYLVKLYNYYFSLDFMTYLHFTSETNLLNILVAGILYQDAFSEKYDSILYIDRDDCITSKNYYEVFNKIYDVKLDISLDDMLEEPKVEARQKISKINFTKQSFKNSSSSETKTILNETYTLSKTTEFVWFKFSEPISASNTPTLSFTSSKSGTATLIDNNTKICYVRLFGEIGETFTLTMTSAQIASLSEKSNSSYSIESEEENGQEITYDITEVVLTESISLDFLASKIKEKDKKYKMSGNFNGNPLIEPRKYVEIETKFGKKNILITKITNTFDGGLTGYFEGVGN